ncbi:MAG: DUF4242 domain-containing protein [Bacteroidetes bacterium]|jgi:hypothetical protein|nr:DUF4242 domain-containing protein [Bacteroidota bacterium]
MPKYLIEREIPNAGAMNSDELRGASQTSCTVLQAMGPEIQWVQSYVAGDKIYCVYIAPDEETIHEHAQTSGFPANRVTAIDAIIDPTTAEAVPA